MYLDINHTKRYNIIAGNRGGYMNKLDKIVYGDRFMQEMNDLKACCEQPVSTRICEREQELTRMLREIDYDVTRLCEIVKGNRPDTFPEENATSLEHNGKINLSIATKIHEELQDILAVL
jgi:hypothetical protein